MGVSVQITLLNMYSFIITRRRPVMKWFFAVAGTTTNHVETLTQSTWINFVMCPHFNTIENKRWDLYVRTIFMIDNHYRAYTAFVILAIK